MGTHTASVVVIGGGVVGAGVLHTLAHHGVDALLLEADEGLAYAASGTSSGVLHTGFDSTPGELETELILRAAPLRAKVIAALDVPVIHCGAVLEPKTDQDRAIIAEIAAGSRANGVEVVLRDDGALEVPGESVSNPVAFTQALADSAVAAGARVEVGARVVGIDRRDGGLTVRLADGDIIEATVVINCAGLYADEIARMVGDDTFEIYPRKGEFFVFELPDGQRLDRIILPVPTKRTKGVLVFPTLDGKVVAGPTAVDLDDKTDWSVRPEAQDEILGKAIAQFPALQGLTPIDSYAGLRPAGRGCNYVIGPSAVCRQLVNVAAIRSTGLTASLGIAAHVTELLPGLGVEVGPPHDPTPVPARTEHATSDSWWQRTAHRYRAAQRTRAIDDEPIMTTVLAIDQGTSGTKAIVVDGDGIVRGTSEHPVRPSYLPGGGVEQDPFDLLASVQSAGRDAIAQAGIDVDIVTIANQGETVLAWDPDTGQPLSTMVVWQDRRAEAICAELADHKVMVEQRTGLVLDPYFSAPKQTWLRRHVTRDGVVTTSDTWLVHQLTGAFVTDASTASRSLVTDLDTGTWDRELLDLFGLGEERLPEIVACDSVVGHTDVFGRRAAVGGLVVDQQAALLGEGCLRPGEAKCTFGTGAFLLANTGTTPTRSTAGLTASIAWRARGETSYCLDGQVYTAASAVRWMERLGYISHAADMDQIAAADNGGVLAIPALAGLGAPWWKPDAKAAVHGMTLSTTVGHLVVAVLEGIAAQVAELGHQVAVDRYAPLSRLRVDGGLTKSKTLMQAVANLMQIDTEVYPNAQATPLGAAALARLAMDDTLTLTDALVDWAPTLTYTPQWSADQAADFRQRWNTLAAAL